MDKFYYKKGPIEVTRPWQRPTWDKFLQWQKDFFKIDGVEKYKVWLCGGFLKNNKNTWDIDIVLTGVPEYSKLGRIMIEGTEIGFERYNILFDIQHHNTMPNFYPNKKIVQKIVFCDRIIKNGKIITDWSDGEKISNNLWIVKRVMPNPKQYKRMLQGYKFADPIKLN